MFQHHTCFKNYENNCKTVRILALDFCEKKTNKQTNKQTGINIFLKNYFKISKWFPKRFSKPHIAFLSGLKNANM